MNTLALINPPNHRHDVYNLAPPLGLLALAKVAEAAGWTVKIIDFDLPEFRELADSPPTFYEAAAKHISSFCPDIVGITSMGVNAHVALIIAKAVKDLCPKVKIVVGGPFFASIAKFVSQIEPSVDVVIKGEGELEFASLLRAISYRDVSIEPPNRDLAHPFSSYRLIDLDRYFESNSRRLLNYESGRGCVFRCSFCYSPAHYKGPYSVTAEQFRSDFEHLSALGAKHIFVVNDNFLNNPKESLALCHSLTRANIDLTWNCYATLPQLTVPVAEALAEAGCTSVYFGVDAVSPPQQKLFKKRFFRDTEDLLSKVQALVKLGISPTCAFIFGLFTPKTEEIAATLRTAALCAAEGAKIRFNALAHYPGTPIALGGAEPCYSEARSRIMLDCPKVVIENPFAKRCPEHFPFHSHKCGTEEAWQQNLNMLWTAQRLIQKFPSYFLELGLADDEAWTQLFYGLGERRLQIESELTL